jgi:hypothetical protein
MASYWLTGRVQIERQAAKMVNPACRKYSAQTITPVGIESFCGDWYSDRTLSSVMMKSKMKTAAPK